MATDEVGHLPEWLLGPKFGSLVFGLGVIYWMKFERDVLFMKYCRNPFGTCCTDASIEFQDHGYRVRGLDGNR